MTVSTFGEPNVIDLSAESETGFDSKTVSQIDYAHTQLRDIRDGARSQPPTIAESAAKSLVPKFPGEIFLG